MRYSDKGQLEPPTGDRNVFENTGLSLHRVTFKFTQEGNEAGSTSDYEELEVEFENILLSPPSGYIVLRTDTGWSIDDPDEIRILLERLQDGVESIYTNILGEKA